MKEGFLEWLLCVFRSDRGKLGGLEGQRKGARVGGAPVKIRGVDEHRMLAVKAVPRPASR